MRAVVASLVLGVVLGGCTQASAPLPRTLAEFPSGVTVAVKVDNPRKIGRHLFVRSEAGAEYRSDVRASPLDVEIYDYRLQIVVLSRLKDGRTVFPVFPVTESVFDPTGAATTTRGRSPLLTAIRPEHSVLDIPLAPEISTYVLLVNGLTEPTGWRVCELDATPFLSGSRDLQIPDPMTLPKISETDPLWSAHRDAEAYYERTARR